MRDSEEPLPEEEQPRLGGHLLRIASPLRCLRPLTSPPASWCLRFRETESRGFSN